MKGHGKDNKNIKYNNPCLDCHHNRDKKKINWKEWIKHNKDIKELKEDKKQ